METSTLVPSPAGTPATALAIVGLGPRGISVIERLAAHLRSRGDAASTPALTLHLIDEAQHGAGRIWETTQTPTLCMNTLAGAVTLFMEPGSTHSAPVLEGPTLFQWVELVRGDCPAHELSLSQQATVASTPVPHLESFDTTTRAEITATRPESHPSRALYGHYLRWVFRVALSQLPQSVTVIQHHARATALVDAGSYDVVELADGTRLRADATVLATGWEVPAPTEAEEHLAERIRAAGAHWVRPDNPIEQPVSGVPAGQEVLVRGMGMGFFDVMAQLSSGRGGRFVEDPSSRAGLRYVASGREPRLVVTSGRGYPYLPKSDYGGLPPRARLTRLRARLAALAETSPATRPGERLDFGRELAPDIVRDAYAQYYATQARVAPHNLMLPVAAILAAIDGADLRGDSIPALARELTAVLAGASSAPLDLARWVDPLSFYPDLDGMAAARLQQAIAADIAADIAEAEQGCDSPLKAALWEISAARKPVAITGQQGRFTQNSGSTSYREFAAFGQMVGSGPPLFRTRQLLALVDAHLITFLGPRPVVTVEDGAIIARSGAREVRSAWLIDAWMHAPDVRRLGDPLARSVASRIRPFTVEGQATASPETTWQRAAVRPDGSADPRLHIIGIPTHAQWPGTTISPLPGTDSLLLQETDRVAASLLRAAGG